MRKDSIHEIEKCHYTKEKTVLENQRFLPCQKKKKKHSAEGPDYTTNLNGQSTCEPPYRGAKGGVGGGGGCKETERNAEI